MSQDGSPSDAQIRRSISTAYYALFHTVLTVRLFGSHERSRTKYAIVYRLFDHGRMKPVREDGPRSILTQTLQRQLKRASFHLDLRDFANSFVVLRASRHGA